MLHLRKILILVLLIAVGVLASELSAQEKEDWQSKLKKINEEPTKVTIETKERAIVFEGDEAKQLVQQLKKSQKKLKFITKQIDSDFEFGDDLDSMTTEFVWVEDSSKGLQEIELEITTEGGEGEKTVTITTDEDGNEKVKVLRGKEAEEYLEKHSGHSLISAMKTKVIMLGEDSDDEEHTIWITNEFEDEGSFEKEIEIKIDSLDNGAKNKVTIKTLKDGEETVDVLVGEEAEKYLKEHSAGKFGKRLLVDGDSKDNVFLIKSKHLKGKKNMNWNFIEEELEEDGNSITKKIKVEVVDGEKKVKVTTIKNGEETVEVLEGKEAEEYLKKHNKGSSMIFISEDGDISNIDGEKIKVRKLGDEEEIEINVEFEDDAKVEKKIKVKKIK